MSTASFVLDGYTVHALTFQMEYVMGLFYNEIYLTSENHSEAELSFMPGSDRFHICDDIRERMRHSDVIFMNEDFTLPLVPDKTDIVAVDPGWKKADEGTVGTFPLNEKAFADKTSIVILSAGDYTNRYYMEILVNKILKEMEVEFTQFFSAGTEALLHALYASGHLNSKISFGKEDSEIMVFSVNINALEDDFQLMRILLDIMPDVMFLCVDQSFQDLQGIENITKEICDISLVMRSPYVAYDVGTSEKYPVYCRTGKPGTYVNSFDNDLEKIVKGCILEKIYLPKGMEILQ